MLQPGDLSEKKGSYNRNRKSMYIKNLCILEQPFDKFVWSPFHRAEEFHRPEENGLSRSWLD